MTVRDETADALYRAICADPDDVALRHVYADRLEELGDPRSEFVRVQLRLAEMEPWDDGYDDLRLRESELLAAHGDEWRRPVTDFHLGGPASAFGRTEPLSRGLIENVVVTPNTLLSRYDELFRAGPIRSIRVVQPGPLGNVLDLPPRARMLALSSAVADRLGPEDAAIVADCPHLSRLERLSLRGNRIGPEGLAELFRSSWLGSMAELDLADNLVDAPPPEPTLPNLRRLDLHRNNLSSDMLGFLRSGWAGRLTRLVLSSNDLRRGDLSDAFAASRLGPGLRSLDLSVTNLRGGEAAAAVVPALVGLVLLDLSGNDLGPGGAVALAELPHLASLRRLRLADGKAGMTGVAAVLSSPHFAGLLSLDIENNKCGDRAFQSLIDAPFAPSIRQLRLSGNSLTSFGVRQVAVRGRLPSLRNLALDRNPLGTPPVMVLLESAAFAGVVRLGLSGVTSEGDSLCAGLAASPASSRLRAVDLSANKIGPRGAKALAASPYLGGLVELTLTGNRLGRRSVEVLRERFGPRVTV